MPKASKLHCQPSQEELVSFARCLCGLVNAEGIQLCYRPRISTRIYTVERVDIMEGGFHLELQGVGLAIVLPHAIKQGTFFCPTLLNPEITPQWLGGGAAENDEPGPSGADPTRRMPQAVP